MDSLHHTTADGAEEVYHTIKLTNATVSNIKYGTSLGGAEGASTAKHSSSADTHELEEVSFTFQKIEYIVTPKGWGVRP